MAQIPTTQNLVAPVGYTESAGLVTGASLEVPESCFGVVTKDGVGVYQLLPGLCTVSQAQFPDLKLRSKGSKSGPAVLDAAFYLINGAPITLPWTLRISLDGADKLTCYEVTGSISVRVTEPLKFSQSAYTQALAEGKAAANRNRKIFNDPNTEAKKLAMASIAHFGEDLAPLIARITVQKAIQAQNLSPQQIQAAFVDLQNSTGPEVAQMLSARGIELQLFRIDNFTGPYPLACQLCGSVGIPVARASFRRTVSLLYLRFDRSVNGLCCKPCAMKYSFGYIGAMLVCGWWGLIGLVLTPIYIIWNICSLIKVLASARCDVPSLVVVASE